MTWDASRYLRDIQVLEISAHLYWVLIRYATLNGLEKLKSESLHNARRCRDICMEEHGGDAFPEGYKKLGEEIDDAMDATRLLPSTPQLSANLLLGGYFQLARDPGVSGIQGSYGHLVKGSLFS